MSLLDQLDRDRFTPEAKGHPAEGCFKNGRFVRIEAGSQSHDYAVRVYDDVSLRMLMEEADLEDGEVLIDGAWDSCLAIYDLQVEVFTGESDEQELQDEIDKIKAGVTQQQQINQQQQPPQPSQPSQPQQPPAPPAPKKTGSRQDFLKYLANCEGALGMGIYEIVEQINQDAEEDGIEFDDEKVHQSAYEVVTQWKNGDFQLDTDGAIEDGVIEWTQPEPEEEEEEEDEEDDASAAGPLKAESFDELIDAARDTAMGIAEEEEED
jgi:hypothetical protein